MSTTTTARPEQKYFYDLPIWNNKRWDHYTPRKDDIIISTSYKAGTTWTQMVCALLVFQKTQFDRPLTTISPWLDMIIDPIEDVIATYEAQTHRRFIKTHAPLDALPWHDDVTYLFCGRDPRDVFMSMQNHLANINPEVAAEFAKRAGAEPPPPLPDDINERFHLWLTQGCVPWESDGLPYWSHMRHCDSFWQFRHLPNIIFLHYADMKADLEGEMRRLAVELGIDVPEDKWPELVEAATFGSMKKRADELAPDVDHKAFADNNRFFHKGTSGQWQDVLSDDNKKLYRKVMQERLSLEAANWLENGTLVAGNPKAI